MGWNRALVRPRVGGRQGQFPVTTHLSARMESTFVQSPPNLITWLDVRITRELKINLDFQAVPQTLSWTPWGEILASTAFQAWGDSQGRWVPFPGQHHSGQYRTVNCKKELPRQSTKLVWSLQMGDLEKYLR